VEPTEPVPIRFEVPREPVEVAPEVNARIPPEGEVAPNPNRNIPPEREVPPATNGETPNVSNTGNLIGSTDNLTPAERAFVEELVDGGKTVEIIPTATGRTADFLIDGVRYELKTLSGVVNQTSDGLSSALSSRIMDARGQSGNIIIDARGQAGMTPEIAERGIIRALGADKNGKIQNITVITSQGTVNNPRIK